MIRSDYLIGLFASVLGGLALPACYSWDDYCGSGAGDGPDSETVSVSVDPERLSLALADGVLDEDECWEFCEDGSDTSETATEGSSSTGSTTDASTGGSTTGEGSTTDGMTTTGEGSTTDATTTGEGSTTDGMTTTGEGSTTGDATTMDPTTDGTSGGGATPGDCHAIEGESAMVSCTYMIDYPVCGRRPSGLCSEGQGEGPTPLSRFFAESAHLEAASVAAFERLAAELRAMAAPDELIVAAERAAADEVRHAQMVGELAENRGGRVSPVDLGQETGVLRSRLEIAIENATEGCVGETWGALLAAHQAVVADDPELRRCMAEIAADEAHHAALAWAIDAFLKDRLTPAERLQVEAARRCAALSLRTSQPSPPELAALVGLPTAGSREQLWAALDQELWHAA